MVETFFTGNEDFAFWFSKPPSVEQHLLCQGYSKASLLSLLQHFVPPTRAQVCTGVTPIVEMEKLRPELVTGFSLHKVPQGGEAGHQVRGLRGPKGSLGPKCRAFPAAPPQGFLPSPSYYPGGISFSLLTLLLLRLDALL